VGGVNNSRWLLANTLLVFKALGRPTSCWLAKCAVGIGALYLFVPYDLIPDRIPILGHADEAGFLFLGFVSARLLVPAELVDSHFRLTGDALWLFERPTLWQHLLFKVRILRSDLADFFLYEHRGIAAYLITGKNSGTHWLKFMLSCALATQYDISPPRYASGKHSNAILRDPRDPLPEPNIPRIACSHTVPSIMCSWLWRSLPHAPVVVLVRDIPAAMTSHYMKWRNHLDDSFSRYVRGDPSGRRYKADIWWYVRFFNRWGDLACANPANILVVRYEDLQTEPEACLRRVALHWKIDISEAAFCAALRFTSRDAIRSMLDPDDTEKVVPTREEANAINAYSQADEVFLRNTIAHYLRHDFGYGYSFNAPSFPAINQ
jgi:hypothetical protein